MAARRRPLAPDPNDSTKTVPAPYNAANSGGSNLGPTSKALNDRVKEDVEKLKAENPLDAGAGRPRHDLGQRARSRHLAGGRALPGAAHRQGAQACRRSASASSSTDNTEGRLGGLLGEPRVNVLALNLALDAASK